MKHIKKLVSGGFIGIGIGQTINLIFSVMKGSYSPGVPSFMLQFDSQLMAVLLLTLAYMVLGILQEYATPIMDNKGRSLLVNTILHFMVVVVPLLIAAYFLHWSRNLLGLISIGVIISLAYVVIWVINYVSIRNEILKINQSLERRNQ